MNILQWSLDFKIPEEETEDEEPPGKHQPEEVIRSPLLCGGNDVDD